MMITRDKYKCFFNAVELVVRNKLIFAGIAIGFFILGFQLLVVGPTPVQAAEPLECLNCHQIALEYHDQLGLGNNACWSCHSPADMYSLKLADDTLLPLTELSQLCGQCHEERYKAWLEGTHGFPGTVAIGTCADCHDPHAPQMAFIGITEPHPEATPSAPELPTDELMIAIVILVFLVLLLIAVIREKAI